MPPRNSTPSAIALRIAAVALGLAAAVAVTEAAFRLAPSRPEPPAVAYGRITTGERTPDFRGRRYDWSPDRRRIVVLGDSFTWGAGVDEELSYPDRLGAAVRDRLGEQAPDVVNFSSPGWNTPQQLRALRSWFTEVRPQHLVVGYCLNDAEPTGRRIRRQLRRPFFDSPPTAPAVAFLEQHSRAFAWGRGQVLRRRQFEAVGRYYHHLYTDDAKGWRATRRALKGLRVLARDWGAGLTLAVFPIFEQRLDEGYRYHDLHRRVLAVAEDEGIDALDLLPAYADQDPAAMALVPFTDAHPSADAHAIAARVLLEHLDRRGVVANLAGDR
ncbi:MAG: SGNH/GDSL hydrolase family protein [Thermoanaerobaculia bacterium]|nr:SGNH/GDSL hydrolase family protein [Thermoanaerobaculia bacterium]